MTLLAKVHASANPAAFPLERIDTAQSAVCLYAAAFLGRNDVTHVWHAGVPYVDLVDIDADKLRQMAAIYDRPGWVFTVADVHDWLEACDITFDVIVADPWSGECQPFMERHAVTVARLAHSCAIFGMHWPADADADAARYAQRLLSRMHPGAGLTVLETVRRSAYLGGIWWVVVKGLAE